LVVIEPTRSIRGKHDFPAAEIVEQLHSSPGSSLATKRCVAYLNVGQAEDYRDYWLEDWRAPTADTAGAPEFVLGVDPDGWEGNFPVAFWHPEWRAVLFGNPEALLDRILADGFDGIYVDWILGSVEPIVVEAARRDGLDPKDAMVELLRDIRGYARARNPLFVLIAQNGVDLVRERPRFLDVIDGFSHEDLSFAGSSSANWGDDSSGGIAAPSDGPMSTANLGTLLESVRKSGVPVFTIDYAVDAADGDAAIRAIRARGLIPFVSRTPLDRLPAAPPQ
jgi:cysteinyl-tRNA synthetase